MSMNFQGVSSTIFHIFRPWYDHCPGSSESSRRCTCIAFARHIAAGLGSCSSALGEILRFQSWQVAVGKTDGTWWNRWKKDRNRNQVAEILLRCAMRGRFCSMRTAPFLHWLPCSNGPNRLCDLLKSAEPTRRCSWLEDFRAPLTWSWPLKFEMIPASKGRSSSPSCSGYRENHEIIWNKCGFWWFFCVSSFRALLSSLS